MAARTAFYRAALVSKPPISAADGFRFTDNDSVAIVSSAAACAVPNPSSTKIAVSVDAASTVTSLVLSLTSQWGVPPLTYYVCYRAELAASTENFTVFTGTVTILGEWGRGADACDGQVVICSTHPCFFICHTDVTNPTVHSNYYPQTCNAGTTLASAQTLSIVGDNLLTAGSSFDLFAGVSGTDVICDATASGVTRLSASFSIGTATNAATKQTLTFDAPTGTDPIVAYRLCVRTAAAGTAYYPTYVDAVFFDNTCITGVSQLGSPVVGTIQVPHIDACAIGSASAGAVFLTSSPPHRCVTTMPPADVPMSRLPSRRCRWSATCWQTRRA